MKKRFKVLIVILVCVLVTSIILISLIEVNSEPKYDIIYKNSSGEERLNLTEEEFGDFYGEYPIVICAIFDFGIEDSYIDQEMTRLNEYDIDARNSIIRNYYVNEFDIVLNDFNIPNQIVTPSRYTPFLWIDVTDESYDDIQEYIRIIAELESVVYFDVNEDPPIRPAS